MIAQTKHAVFLVQQKCRRPPRGRRKTGWKWQTVDVAQAKPDAVKLLVRRVRGRGLDLLDVRIQYRRRMLAVSDQELAAAGWNDDDRQWR